MKKRIIAVTVGLALMATVALSGCSSAENWIAEAMRALGNSPGTIYNFGIDGQIVLQAHCRSVDFTPDHQFDQYNAKGEKTGDSSMLLVACGDSQIRTVGYTTVYVSDDAQGAIFANSQQFANIRIQNNDRSIPLLNFAWRSVKNRFVGTVGVVQFCDQWNDPIMAFAGEINGFATEVAKSTMFQVKYDNKTGYIWISHGSYSQADMALLNR